MSGRTLVRVGAVVVGLAGLVLTVPTLATTDRAAEKAAEKARKAAGARDAAARCCAVALNGLGGTVTAGGSPAIVNLTLSGTTNGCTPLRRTITVRLAGLTADAVRLDRAVDGDWIRLPARTAADGTVQVTDELAETKLCGVDSQTVQYQLTFLADAPNGTATVSGAALTPAGKSLGSDTTTGTVVSAAALPSPTNPDDDATPGGDDVPPAGNATSDDTAPPADDTAPPAGDGATPGDDEGGAEQSATNDTEADTPEPTGSAIAPAVAVPPARDGRSYQVTGLSAVLMAIGVALGSLTVLLAGLFSLIRQRQRARAVRATAATEPGDAIRLALPAGGATRLNASTVSDDDWYEMHSRLD